MLQIVVVQKMSTALFLAVYLAEAFCQPQQAAKRRHTQSKVGQRFAGGNGKIPPDPFDLILDTLSYRLKLLLRIRVRAAADRRQAVEACVDRAEVIPALRL